MKGFTTSATKATFGGEELGDETEDTEGREADDERNDEFHGAGSVLQNFARLVRPLAKNQTHGDGPGENADVVGRSERVEGIVDEIEDERTEHVADAARSIHFRTLGNELDLGGKHEARRHGDERRGEVRGEINEDDGLDVDGFAQVAAAGDRTHDEHEDENRGDALQGRDEDGPEKARGLGEFGRREAEKTAENETYENLLDEGSLQKRHGKAEDFA